MSERIPPGMIRIGCTCCQLPQVIKDRDGAIPKVCDTCYPHHRGERIETRLSWVRAARVAGGDGLGRAAASVVWG